MLPPLYDFGGQGRPLVLALANGFPPQSYRPLLYPLTDRYRVVCLLPRALWPEPSPPEQFHSWTQMADDLAEGLRRHDLRDAVLIGHSMGGVVCTLAALAEPQRCRGLALLDPVFLPRWAFRGWKLLRLLKLDQWRPLVRKARARRRHFASLDEAFAYYRGKRLFHDWPDETVRLYAESLLRPRADGQGYELAWSPEWEARYYLGVYTELWDVVPRLRGLLPVLAVAGSHSRVFTPEAADLLRELVPDVTYHMIEGHGHFFPQSAPNETRRILLEWLKG